MLRLLSIELHKIRYNKASKVLTIIYFGLLTCIALIAAIRFDFAGFRFDITTTGIFNFPYIWHFNTWVASTIKFFLLLVIVSMTANEYSYKTLKQNLIDGISKKEFILSKFLTVTLFALISTLFVFLVSLVLGLLYSDYNEMTIIFSDMQYILAFFVKLLGFFSFGLFAGILVKRSAFAVGVMVVWWFIEGIVKLIIAIVLGTTGRQDMIGDTIADVLRYFPFEAMSNLIKEPFTKLGAVKSVANQVGEQFTKNHDVQVLDVLIVLIWTGIFIWGSYALLKKRDL
jgi:ABC-type transport system involved in multi-copper enzyme maturation permease subunit